MLLSAATNLFGFGTSEGVEKAWDARGRGRKEDEKKSGLQELVQNASKMFGPNNLWSKLAQYGHDGRTEKFTPEEKTYLKELKQGVGNCRIGYCVMNAQKLATHALGDPRVNYVEGLVTVHGVPLDHAWIEFNGKVFDPTTANVNWKIKTGAPKGEYFGVTVPKNEIFKNQLRTRTYSFLSHQWGNKDLMGKIWKESN